MIFGSLGPVLGRLGPPNDIGVGDLQNYTVCFSESMGCVLPGASRQADAVPRP